MIRNTQNRFTYAIPGSSEKNLLLLPDHFIISVHKKALLSHYTLLLSVCLCQNGKNRLQIFFLAQALQKQKTGIFIIKYSKRGGSSMYSKILVAFDDSEGSHAALEQAAEIADLHHSELFLVYAAKEKRPASSRPMYTLPYGPGETAGYAGTATMDYQEEETATRTESGVYMLEQARKKLHLADSRVHTEILHGDPAREICKFASQKEINLIVIGNRGLRGVRKLMLGSVSQKIAQHAHCPVMIVK